MPLNQHIAKAPRRGMIVRSKETLEAGLVLFKLGHRFNASTRQSDLEVLSSPWWFTRGAAELVCQRAAASGSGLSDMFRRFGAVAKRWGGSADLVVRAELGAPVVAYIGPGTIQDFRHDKAQAGHNAWDMPLWVPSAAIPQVHVPLMNKGDVASSVAEDAFRSVYIVPIDKWDDDYINGPPKGKWRLW